jgi:ribose 5-phosphate isomerase A
MGDLDALKRMAAESAVAQVSNGMTVGLGTGSTAEFVLLALARRIREGLRITGVPTSEHTAARARELGIALGELDGKSVVDIAIDGADEVEQGTLHLIKGRGGALLREKIVAQASARFLVVVDQTKLVKVLGAGPVPVEVVPFGWHATARRLQDLGGRPERRDFVTDSGNLILDCAFDPIQAPESLASDLDHIAGVVEHGLFISLATEVHVGAPSGVQVFAGPRGSQSSILLPSGS